MPPTLAPSAVLARRELPPAVGINQNHPDRPDPGTIAEGRRYVMWDYHYVNDFLEWARELAQEHDVDTRRIEHRLIQARRWMHDLPDPLPQNEALIEEVTIVAQVAWTNLCCNQILRRVAEERIKKIAQRCLDNDSSEGVAAAVRFNLEKANANLPSDRNLACPSKTRFACEAVVHAFQKTLEGMIAAE